jgi:hypothetical protein
MIQRFFQKKNKAQIFWDWFIKNEDAYFCFEKNQDALFTKLKVELEKINLNIVFEFSPILKDGTREFVISADGVKSTFPIVADLVKQAPSLKRWKIIAFRQPHFDITHIYYQDLIINFNDVFFRYAKDNGQINLELNIRGFYESPEWASAVFILLDNILGEYDTEMYLSYIDKKELNENEVEKLFPIRILPQIIKEYQFELNN